MGLKLNTASGGSVSIEPTNTASNYTLTVPAQTGTVIASDSSGNVGIGTTTPVWKLDVYNGAGSSYGRFQTGSSTDEAGIELKNTAGSTYIYKNANTNNLAVYIGGVDRLKIDSSGRVTMPYQPAFLAQYSSGATINSGQTAALAFNSSVYNIGSHYNTSTYRFTAPVAGVYVFYTGVGGNGGQPANSYFGIAFQVNGSTQNAQWQNSAAGYQVQKHTQAFNLNAGDYVTVWCEVSSTFSSQAPFFGGYLLG